MRFLKPVVKWLCKKEYETQRYVGATGRSVEFAFVFKQIAEHNPRAVLDVGTGDSALPSLIRDCGCLVTATDVTNTNNRHFHVIKDDITQTKLTEKFDMITCVSVLEHIEQYNLAVSMMLSMLMHGGLLVLTFPYTEHEFIENVYASPESLYYPKPSEMAHSFSRQQLEHWRIRYNAEITDQEYWRCWTGEFWSAGEKRTRPIRRICMPHDLTCICFRKG